MRHSLWIVILLGSAIGAASADELESAIEAQDKALNDFYVALKKSPNSSSPQARSALRNKYLAPADERVNEVRSELWSSVNSKRPTRTVADADELDDDDTDLPAQDQGKSGVRAPAAEKRDKPDKIETKSNKRREKIVLDGNDVPDEMSFKKSRALPVATPPPAK